MPDANLVYLNAGIYSVAEASQLTRVSTTRIRRWLRGYKSTTRGKTYDPLWRGQFKPIDNRMALGFLDLMEIKFVGAFRVLGVSWHMIHRACEKAAERFPDESHPFCTRRFLTDGKEIFIQLHKETGEPSLMEIVGSQQVFAEILGPYLKGLEFNAANNILERWWPLGTDRGIVVDPKRNFGQPSIFERDIPTRVLAKSVQANGSIEIVAKWYDMKPALVKEAVEYEVDLAA